MNPESTPDIDDPFNSCEGTQEYSVCYVVSKLELVVFFTLALSITPHGITENSTHSVLLQFSTQDITPSLRENGKTNKSW